MTASIAEPSRTGNSATAAGSVRDAAVAGPVGAYAWYVLFVIVLVQALAVLDRIVLSVLVEDIRKDFALSDTQIGLVSGFLTTGIYACAGLVISRLADRSSRKVIISVCVAIWSAFTALGGFATNFVLLAVSRTGLALGEGGATAPAQSLISDYFPPRRRAFAIAILSTGSALGMAAMAGGAYLSHVYGWQVALMTVGGLGLFIAALVHFTVREPVRGGLDPLAKSTAPIPLGQSFRILRLRKSYKFVLLGMAFYTFGNSALAAFQPAYLARTLDFSTTSAGVFSGLSMGGAGFLGTLVGGAVATAMGLRGAGWLAGVPAVGLLLAAACAAIGLLSGSAYPYFIVPAFFLAWAVHGPGYAMVQSMVPPQLRSFAAALLILMTNAVGSSLGPLVVGSLSDMMASTRGEDALGVALLATPIAWTFGAICFVLAARHIGRDFEQAHTID